MHVVFIVRSSAHGSTHPYGRPCIYASSANSEHALGRLLLDLGEAAHLDRAEDGVEAALALLLDELLVDVVPGWADAPKVSTWAVYR